MLLLGRGESENGNEFGGKRSGLKILLKKIFAIPFLCLRRFIKKIRHNKMKRKANIMATIMPDMINMDSSPNADHSAAIFGREKN